MGLGIPCASAAREDGRSLFHLAVACRAAGLAVGHRLDPRGQGGGSGAGVVVVAATAVGPTADATGTAGDTAGLKRCRLSHVATAVGIRRTGHGQVEDEEKKLGRKANAQGDGGTGQEGNDAGTKDGLRLVVVDGLVKAGKSCCRDGGGNGAEEYAQAKPQTVF